MDIEKFNKANKIHSELKKLKEFKEILESSRITSINYIINNSYNVYTASFPQGLKEDLDNLINSKINKLKNEFKSI